MRVRVKVCGLTNLGDARCAVEAGADYLGFIFVVGSPRCVTPAAVDAIVRALPATVTTVGVFMDQPAADVRRTLAACGLGVAQLHGAEAESVARAIGPERVWKAVSLRTAQDVEAAAAYPAAAVLADAVVGGRRGGTGQVCDWGLAAQVAARRPLVLAGGLTADNVAAAVRQVRPFAVDVGSGVELRPGVKDPARVRAFVAAARAALDGLDG